MMKAVGLLSHGPHHWLTVWGHRTTAVNWPPLPQLLAAQARLQHCLRTARQRQAGQHGTRAAAGGAKMGSVLQEACTNLSVLCSERGSRR